MRLPLKFEPNGETPDEDGYIIFDRDNREVGLIYQESDAKEICELCNNLMS